MATSLKKIIQSFLKNVLGIQIYRVKKTPVKDDKPQLKMIYVHDPAYSYMPQPAYQEELHRELAGIADSFLSSNLYPNASTTDTLTLVRDFFELYSHREKTDNTHGSGFHNAFWLYLISRTLNPATIVESGVWKGHSTWLFSKACPQAEIFGFDISLNKFEFPDLNAHMFEQDWQTFEFPDIDPDRSLIFFDCHVNHAQRILEAKKKGFKHLLFDDNPPIHKIFTHIPGIPTAAMLVAGQGIDQTELSWVWNGETVTKPIDPQEALDAKRLIKHHLILPDVGNVTRYGGFSFLTYVQI